jgi:hypothetical protein
MRRSGSTANCRAGAAIPAPATIQGLNMPNRVVLGTEVKPGDRFQLAVFAINGPMSDPFGSIWFRQAMVEFYR